MKKRSILAILSVLALAACASTPESRSPTEIDYDYVNSVEAQARSVGVDVQWVNPPRRKRADENQG